MSDKQTTLGIGGKRREIINTIEEMDSLDTISNFNSLDEITTALSELHIPGYSDPPREVIDSIEEVHDQLPSDAQSHFVADDILAKRVNAARNQFNTYRRRVLRMKEMPSPIESGPANYPADKARQRTESLQKAREELDDAVSAVDSAATGARQRALEAIGSSVAEQNEQDREETRQSRRKQLSAGDLVGYRSPRLHVGEVIRVNKKSLRVRRPNPRAGQTKPLSDEPEPDVIEERVDLDSDFLTPLLTDQDVAEFGDSDYEDYESLESLKEGEGLVDME